MLNDLTDEYEAAVGPPGVVQLKMNINFVCAYQDKDTGFIVSTVFEYYVSIGLVYTSSPVNT